MIPLHFKPFFLAIYLFFSLHIFAQSTITRSYRPLYTPALPTNLSNSSDVSIPSNRAALSVGNPPVTPSISLTPEISQLNLLRDLPVNKFTGSPVINIPITELKEGNLSVPISLSYQSSGIKINQVASWVGLGWDLVGVPMLTRVVRDLPDEGKWDSGNTARTGYYYNSAMASSFFINLFNDNEPDYFFFTYQGQTVKFFFDYNGQAHFDPAIDATVQVKVRNSYNSSTVYQFDQITITLADGTAYFFSDNYTESSMEVPVEDVYNSNMYPGQSNYETFAKANKIVSAWFCYKITHPLGHQINIQYDKQGYSYYKLADQIGEGYLPTYNANKLNRAYIYTCSVSSIEGSLAKIVFNNGINQNSTYRDPETGQNIVTSFPNVNYYSRTDLEGFTQSPQNQSQAKILKFISLLDKTNTTKQLVWGFVHDYFVSNSNDLPSTYSNAGSYAVGDTHKKRLKLLAIEFPDVSRFKFTYQNSNDLPSRFTFASDHWGYFNNISGNDAYGQVGKDYDNPNGSGSSKRADEQFTKYGILKSISSTSGIHSVYEFEGNRCSNYNAGNEELGGLRIKSISSIDSVRMSTQTKKYSYLNEDGSSSGFLVIKPKYRHQNPSGTYFHFSGLYSYLLSEANRPILGYSRVVEETYSNADLGLSTGKMVTLFNQPKTELNLEYNDNGTTRYYLHKFHPESDPSIGSVAKETTYTQNGNVISETSYSYNLPSAELNLYAVKKNRFLGDPSYTTSEGYYQYIKIFRLEATQQKSFD